MANPSKMAGKKISGNVNSDMLRDVMVTSTKSKDVVRYLDEKFTFPHPAGDMIFDCIASSISEFTKQMSSAIFTRNASYVK